MSTSKTVRISELYPSNVQDLSKFFRDAQAVHSPYGLSREGSTERQIQNLVAEVETGQDISDPKRTNGPYSTNLDERVDTVNAATTFRTNDPTKQVPEDIRFVQLAHLHDPEVDGQRYSYGLFMHFGVYENPSIPREFAVLLPYEKQKGVPALVLSNGEVADKPLELMIKALAYSRQRPQ